MSATLQTQTPPPNLLPAPLKAGGTLALIAPAGPGELNVDLAHRWALERGHPLRIFPGVQAREGYLAGSDQQRLEDFHQAFADPEVAAILCLRGGYGSPRLLDQIDFDLIRRHPKPFVGYSDLTALQLGMARHAGLLSFHGPLFNADLLGGKQAPTEASMWQLLRGEKGAGDVLEHPAGWPLITVAPGCASGTLLGGNLSLICATLGTDWALEADGIVLFIEDVNEPPYKVDRLLTQLRLAGLLGAVRGVLVGDFAGLAEGELKRLLTDFFGPLGIPVLAGWRSGHCDPNLTLPMGALVELDATARRLTLLQDVVSR